MKKRTLVISAAIWALVLVAIMSSTITLVLTGSVGQTVNSTLSSSSPSASLSLQSTFLGGGHALALNGPGQIGLAGGASGLASLSQALGNRLDLGSGQGRGGLPAQRRRCVRRA